MNDRLKGIIYMLGGCLSFSLMSAAAKFTKEVPLPEKLFVRNCFAVIVALFLIFKNGEKIKGNNEKFLIARAVVGFIGALLYFYAVNHLPLGDVTLLNKVCPFFIIILSAVFLGEKIQKHHIPILILGLTGAGFVLKPVFHSNSFAAIIALTSSVTSGVAFTIVRYLRKTDTPRIIFLYFAGISALGTLPLMLMGSFRVPTTIEFLGLLFMGLFTSTQQLCVNNAYRYAPAGELSVFEYTTILFSIVIGLLMWQEIPDVLSLLGGFLIIIAGITNYKINKSSQQLEVTLNQ